VRLAWRCFPPQRMLMSNLMVSLFIDWARIGDEAVIKLDRSKCEQVDRFGKPVCRNFIAGKCENPFCKSPHVVAQYDRTYLQVCGAYIEFKEFSYFVSAIFDTKFTWTNETYIYELYMAYSKDRVVIHRIDPMSRSNEVVRQKVTEESKVMSFGAYLEVMTILEEHRNGFKDIHLHKLFKRIYRSCYGQSYVKPPVDLDSIDGRVYIDKLEQYDRGIDIPSASSKGARFITKKGLEHAERSAPTPVMEYIETCKNKTNQASALVDKLFG
jgi:hypothetical protein